MKTVIGFVKALDQLTPPLSPPYHHHMSRWNEKFFINISSSIYDNKMVALIAALHLLILLSVSFICKYFLRTLKRFS